MAWAPARAAAVVKANAYGLGAVPVARALLAGGCDTLFVATASEAIELRDAGIECALFVFEGALAHSASELAARGIPVDGREPADRRTAVCHVHVPTHLAEQLEAWRGAVSHVRDLALRCNGLLRRRRRCGATSGQREGREQAYRWNQRGRNVHALSVCAWLRLSVCIACSGCVRKKDNRVGVN